MRVELLGNKRLPCFIEYCRKHRFEHDESFLYEEDLLSFNPDESNPTYILLNEDNDITGVVSLMILPYINNSKHGRFRIFHCAETNFEVYNLLFIAIKSHISDLDNVSLFIPEQKTEVRNILKSLHFDIYRYSWVLVRDNIEVPKYILPEGYYIKTFEFNKDEDNWCKVRNAAFATLKGSETPTTPEAITALKDCEDYVEGGLLMLYKDQEPIGVIRIIKEHENDKAYAFVAPLAIAPEYQGKGFGRILLRAGLAYGKTVNLQYGMLCVNAENERATDLYTKEGFTKIAVMACYKYQIK
jgi:mycothiol synthase